MRKEYGKVYRLHKRLVKMDKSFWWFFRNHSSLNYATGMMQLYGINELSEKLKNEIEIFLRRERNENDNKSNN